MGLVNRWKICTQYKQPNYSTWLRWPFSHAGKRAICSATVALLLAKRATSSSLAKDKPRTCGACSQARIQFHSAPTRPQRVGAIPSPLWLLHSFNEQAAPSLSVVSAFEAFRLRGFAVFLWRICAPSPPLEILISLERMARIGKVFSHPCMFTRFQVLFFFGRSQELAARYHNRKSRALHLEKGTEYSGSANLENSISRSATPRWSLACACTTSEASKG